MKKLILFLCILFAGTMTWSQTTVTISDQTDLDNITSSNVTTETAHKYGTYSGANGGDTFTTNATSGVAGVTITTTANIIKPTWYSNSRYGYCLALKSSNQTEYTITITAPIGYLVRGYSFKAITTSDNNHFYITPQDSTQVSTPNPGYNADVCYCIVSYTASENVLSQTATFKIQGRSDGGELCFPFFTVELAKKVTALDQSATDKTYNITTARGWWAVASGADAINSTASAGNGLDLALSHTDTKQQFAIIPFEGIYYLYSVGEGKFAYQNGTKLSLNPYFFNYAAGGLTFTASTHSTAADYPTVPTVNGRYFGVSTGYNPTIYNWQSTNDGGNSALIVEATTFDPSGALAKLPISDLASLSNAKSYYVTCDRGTLGVTNNQLTSTSKSSYTASPFAIISYNSQYYLYNVDAGKFINADGTASNDSPTPLTINSLGGSRFMLKFGSNAINTSSNYDPGLVINNYVTADPGNQYYIAPADDFDPTDALAILYPHFGHVRYQLSDAHGIIYTSESYIVAPGSTVTTMPSELERDFCSYSVTSTTAVAGTVTTVPVTVTYSLPFIISTDYATASWFYAKIRDNKYLRADDSHKDGSGRYQTNGTNEKTDYYKWAFFGNPYSNFYIANMGQGDGKYLYAGSQPTMQTVADPASTDAALWAVTVNGNGFTLRSVTGATLFINDAGNGGNLGYWNSSWGATDGGSKWNVEPVSTVEVTYNVVLNGVTIATATEEQGIGFTPEVPDALKYDYTSYTYDVDELTATTTTVTATPTFSMPFVTSTDYASAKWYYLHAHASWNDMYVSTNGDATVWEVENNMTSDYEWAFIGNPIQGIKVINKTSGATKCLQSTDPATMGTTEKTWVLKQQTNTGWECGANGFGLWDATRTYLNTQAGTLKYWGSFDQGSTFWVEEVPDFAALVRSEIGPWFAADKLDIPFGLDTESSGYASFRSDYETYSVNCTYAQYQALKADLPSHIKYPETGYYRIKSSGLRIGESYIAYGQPTANAPGLITVTAAKAPTDYSTILHFTERPGVGVYTLSTQGLNVQNQMNYNVAFPATAAAGVDFTFVPRNPGIVAITNDKDEYGYLHEAGWEVPAVVCWTADASSSQWSVEEVTSVTVSLNNVGDEYYATLCVPFSFSITRANAYTLERTGNSLIPTEEPIVVAGTPVMLRGNSSTATIDIGSNYDYESTPVTGTALTGVFFPTTIDGSKDYVLGKLNGKVGFYHWSSNNLKANRAYLEGDSSAGEVKGYVISMDGTDAIQTIEEAKESNVAIYNLAGQRVSKAEHGVYIINGRKVVKN